MWCLGVCVFIWESVDKRLEAGGLSTAVEEPAKGQGIEKSREE